MTIAKLIHQAEAEGVSLTLSADGELKASGERDAVNRWLPLIRVHKVELQGALRQLQQQAELRRIVPLVCAAYGCTPEEITEALHAALNDIDDALTCYRSLMDTLKLTPRGKC